MKPKSTYSERDLLKTLERICAEILPAGWRLALQSNRRTAGSQGIDALLTLTASDDPPATFAVVVKTRIEPRDILGLVAQARACTELPLLVVAPYLSRRSQDLLYENGVSYVDATRNTRINLDTRMFICTTGAMADPGRASSPLKSLRGAGTARAVRALCDYRLPLTIQTLAKQSNTPLATLWRVADLLQREALLVRGRKGIESVDWKGLLARWADDYSFTESNVTRTYLEPRGVPALLTKLRKRARGYAVTGSFAVADLLPIVTPPVAMVYVADAEVVAEDLKLTAVETGPNVVLAEPLSPVVFDRVRESNGLIAAAVSQAAVDLLTGPGRAPTEAEELIAWMEANEDAWRT